MDVRKIKRRSSAEIIVDFKRYRGKQVVIFNGRVVADDDSSAEALRKAEVKFPRVPRTEFILFFVPKSPLFIYPVTRKPRAGARG
ncbi:hypothetical protein A2935_03235 [Candidatus Wolfebacteria bacterium RIFCSPLOWO2_01_FULL_47_17b]|uniref:DUF5678 domain-containing protein n=1 Tax=Candidatus Wolfebacteria bacterium RIFCSPLOWO2_01_FULL_47_17b TaxID=1802558 RepID=A0A1F8E059_9BACT|nr:MAG: hypothetical protein A2935_03235 [Candidatus Wolfebacteria bacterium RIFCSPLOWO2_01_FULL_47_17b]